MHRNEHPVCIYIELVFFNKIAIGLNNGLEMAFEPGAGTHDNVPVYKRQSDRRTLYIFI